MFTSRIRWSLEENALTKALRTRREAGEAVTDLTVANPPEVGFAWDKKRLAEIYARADLTRHDPDPRGMRTTREAVAAYYAGRGAAVDPDDIRLCASTSEGCAWILKLMTNPGDEALVAAPSYPLFEYIAALECVGLRPWMTPTGRIGEDALEAAMSERTRLILTVSPNNPTGATLSPEDRDALRRAAGRRGVAIAADEVFLDYPASGYAMPETFAGERATPAFALSGLSKITALPQAKLAWIVIAGPDKFRAEAGARLDHIADTYLSASAAAQLAAPALLAEAAPIRAAIRARCDANDATLREWCAHAGHGVIVEPRPAGWYATLRLPPGIDEERATLDLLRCGGALVHPGHFFGHPPDEARWILSLLTPEERLRGAFTALDSTMRRL